MSIILIDEVLLVIYVIFHFYKKLFIKNKLKIFKII